MTPTRRFVAACGGVFVLSRLAVLTLLVSMRYVRSDLSLRFLVGSAYDSGWYVGVAQHGYPTSVPHATGPAGQSAVAFLPGWPLLLRFAHAVSFAPWWVTASVCNFLLGAWGAVLLGRLVAVRFGVGTGLAAVALLAFSPGSFVLSLAYAEALFLVLAVGAFVAMDRQRWLAAGALAGGAALVRPQGLVLVAVVVLAGVGPLLAGAGPRLAGRARSVVAGWAAAAAGALAFHGYLRVHTGEWWVWSRAQRQGWGQGFSLGSGLWHLLDGVMRHPLADPSRLGHAMVLVYAAGGLVLGARRLPWTWTAYSIGVVGLAFGTSSITSTARFALVAFPIVVGYAVALPVRWRPLATAVSATGLAWWVVLTLGAFRVTV